MIQILLGELIGIEKVKKTVTATLEGSIIYSGGIGFNSYIVSCNDGGMPFNLTIISNSGNIHLNIINGMIRKGYSIYVDGDKKQYLKIKRITSLLSLRPEFHLCMPVHGSIHGRFHIFLNMHVDVHRFCNDYILL